MSETCHECGRLFPAKVYRHPRADMEKTGQRLRYDKKSTICAGSPPVKEKSTHAHSQTR